MGCDLGVKISGQTVPGEGTVRWKQAQASGKESPWLGREEWVGGCLQGGAGRGLGVFWNRGSHAGPVRCYCLSERKFSGQGWGAWLTYHPFSWGAFPFLHHLPGWPWGFIMGVSEPPLCPVMSCSAPTFRFGLGPLWQSL